MGSVLVLIIKSKKAHRQTQCIFIIRRGSTEALRGSQTSPTEVKYCQSLACLAEEEQVPLLLTLPFTACSRVSGVCPVKPCYLNNPQLLDAWAMSTYFCLLCYQYHFLCQPDTSYSCLRGGTTFSPPFPLAMRFKTFQRPVFVRPTSTSYLSPPPQRHA